MKIGILTGGGDCPGLNAVIYGVLLQAFESKHEVIGIEKGWKGFLENTTVPLKIAELDDLHTRGGTILFTSRTNPYKEVLSIKDEEQRKQAIKKRAHELADQFNVLGIDVLIAVCGDDTLGVANSLYQETGVKIIGVPKTIDNDLSGTDYTFGFWSAVQLASNTIDNLTTTAHSHQRIFVVEVMGRDAGWLTLMSGISAGADIILVPEIKFDFEKDIVEVLRRRVRSGYKYHIIAFAEGALPTHESFKRDFKTFSEDVINSLPLDAFGNPILAKLNMSRHIVEELSARTDLKMEFEKKGVEFEVRDVILGHTMRAGTPNSFDRTQGLRLGMHAAMLIDNGDFGKMVTIRGDKIETVPLATGTKKKLIDVHSDLIKLKNLITEVRYRSKEQFYE